MPPNLAALERRHCDCATAGPGPTGVTCGDSSTCLLKRDTGFARGLSPSSDSDDPPRSHQRRGGPIRANSARGARREARLSASANRALTSPAHWLLTACCQASLSSPGSRPGRASLICFASSGATGLARTTVRLHLSRAGRGQASLASPGPDRGQASSAGLGPHFSRLARAVDRLRSPRTDRCQAARTAASLCSSRPGRCWASLAVLRLRPCFFRLARAAARFHSPLTASLTSPAFMQLHTAFTSGNTLLGNSSRMRAAGPAFFIGSCYGLG